MPNETEYFNPYAHMGRLHNEGVDYVIAKLSNKKYEQVRKLDIIELTAEYMFLIDCCEADISLYLKKEVKLSKIKYVVYIEFLTNLHHYLADKLIIDLAKEAGISPEFYLYLDIIISNAIVIDEANTFPNSPHVASRQMLDFFEKKTNESSIDESQRRAIGVLTAVSKASIDHGLSIVSDSNKRGKYELVNAKADKAIANEPVDPVKNKFKWNWKADAEGALGGLITGGITFSLPGALIGAVGGSISNSIIKSIPYFNSK